MEEQTTNPNSFFATTIDPVFSDEIFSEENLSNEYQKPDLKPTSVFRDTITTAANDEDLSLGEYDAAASLATQELESQLLNQDNYTRSKRDLEFNINAERDVQFNQGQQLLRDIDAYTQAQRATVVQREYEKELERQEELLADEKKEALQLQAMQLGIDPNGLSRKELRTAIAEMTATQYQDKLTTSRMSKGGSSSDGCPAGTKESVFGCVPTATQNDVVNAMTLANNQLGSYTRVDDQGNFYSSKNALDYRQDDLRNYFSTKFNLPNVQASKDKAGSWTDTGSYWATGQSPPKTTGSTTVTPADAQVTGAAYKIGE